MVPDGDPLLLFGGWLVPRTIGVHTRIMRRNGELSSRVRMLTATRVEAIDTAAAELRRVERDLHDGAQARLLAVGMSLRARERLIRSGPDAAISLVAKARENSARALADLRGLVRGINPPVLEHCTSIFAKLDLPPDEDDNRRVLAVLAYLNS